MTTSAVPHLQSATLLVFARLLEMRANWSRRLIVCFSAEMPAQALALAAVGLGSAVLLVSRDTALLRSANRAGATDFQVDTLSEALRILKNELRKGTAVSVGLSGDAGDIAQEMLHRGVQPDSVVLTGKDLIADFLQRGAEPLVSDTFPFLISGRPWTVMLQDAESPAGRKQQDFRLLSDAHADAHGGATDPVAAIHRRWLAVAPRLFPRDRQRALLTSNAAERS